MYVLRTYNCRASAIEIKMFAASNLTASSQGRQRASTKDGYLEVETTDSYGDLNTTWDVVMAWLTLSAIWQKLFPDWPVAIIRLRTIFTMKLFQHCRRDHKKMMIELPNMSQHMSDVSDWSTAKFRQLLVNIC